MSQEAIYRDTDRMTRTQSLVDKLQAGHHTKSIIDDFGKKGTSHVFSEASRRTIKELGNIEIYELGEISTTVQCTTCLRYSEEGTIFCTCGVCLMPLPDQIKKIKNRFEIMSNPFYFMKEEDSRGSRHGPQQWQYDHWKAKDAKKGTQNREYETVLHR